MAQKSEVKKKFHYASLCSLKAIYQYAQKIQEGET